LEKNGPKYRGVYINEMICPILRGIKEINSKSIESTEPSTTSAATEYTSTESAEQVITKSIKQVVATSASACVGAASLGMSLTASAFLSSYWKERPHIIDNDNEFTSEGKLPDDFNEDSIKIPSEQLKFTITDKEK
ncbi:9825_t:CDS:1, partial [Scutellospora calospora]